MLHTWFALAMAIMPLDRSGTVYRSLPGCATAAAVRHPRTATALYFQILFFCIISKARKHALMGHHCKQVRDRAAALQG